jgi:hypothetical protein
MATKTLHKRKDSREERRVKPGADDLRVAAYYRWLSRGCPPGDDLTDWVAVEQEYEEEAKNRSTHDI